MQMKRIILMIMALMILPRTYAQTLIIATTTDNPPFSSIADQHNHFYGFDIEIIDEICKRMKAQCQYSSLVFNNLLLAINNKQIDLAIAANIITPNQQQKYLFSLPYMASHVQFITNINSAQNSPDDLKNKRIGVLQGSAFGDLVMDLYKNQITVIEYPHVSNLFLSLDKNVIDAVLLNKDSAQYWYANNGNQYKLISPPITFGSGYGIMAKLGEESLIEKVNDALLSMESDGTYLKIYSHYFG
jgi:ABC-type amino acid transport substrate-binding protein